jgi:hypothetical protein
MKSFDQIQNKFKQTEVSPFVWTRIQSQIENDYSQQPTSLARWQIVAVAAIVITLNAWGLFSFNRIHATNQNSNSTVVDYNPYSPYSLIRYE